MKGQKDGLGKQSLTPDDESQVQKASGGSCCRLSQSPVAALQQPPTERAGGAPRPPRRPSPEHLRIEKHGVTQRHEHNKQRCFFLGGGRHGDSCTHEYIRGIHALNRVPVQSQALARQQTRVDPLLIYLNDGKQSTLRFNVAVPTN